jgi:hypothetical protein
MPKLGRFRDATGAGTFGADARSFTRFNRFGVFPGTRPLAAPAFGWPPEREPFREGAFVTVDYLRFALDLRFAGALRLAGARRAEALRFAVLRFAVFRFAVFLAVFFFAVFFFAVFFFAVFFFAGFFMLSLLLRGLPHHVR